MTFIARYQLDAHLVCLFQSDQEIEQHFWPSWSKRTLSSPPGQNLEGVVAPRFLVYRGPLLHKNSGPVNQRDPSTSCFVVSPLDASSAGLLFVAT